MNAWILDKLSVQCSLLMSLRPPKYVMMSGPLDLSLWLARPLGYWERQLLLDFPPGAPGPRRCTISSVSQVSILLISTHIHSIVMFLFLYSECNVNSSFCVARNLCASVRVPVGVCSPECRLHWAKPQVWCGSLQFSSILGASNGLQSDIQFPWLLRPRIEVTWVSSRNGIQHTNNNNNNNNNNNPKYSSALWRMLCTW